MPPWRRFFFAVYRAAVADSHPERGARGRHGPGSLRAQPWCDVAGPGGDVRLPRKDYGTRHEVGSEGPQLTISRAVGWLTYKSSTRAISHRVVGITVIVVVCGNLRSLCAFASDWRLFGWTCGVY